VALSLVEQLPEEARFVLGDTHDNAPEVCAGCLGRGKYLVASGRVPYPHTDPGAEVRCIFHRLRHSSIENFKTIFECHQAVPI